ncbi:MAG: hypothetical protein PF508_02075 [Spirochaeta sp.]|nr:hypothetical protein [Spirochaeta sp.]
MNAFHRPSAPAGRCFPIWGILTVLAIASATPVFAFEWGGSITTNNTVQSVAENSDDDVFVNTEALVLYLTAPLGSQWEFVGQLGGSYDSAEPVFAADLEKLYFQRNRTITGENEQPAGLVGMTTRFGRFLMSDPTGLIMSHPIDGAAFILNYVNFELYAGAGYTGFINKEFSSVGMGLQDSVDQEDDDVYFGPARLLGLLRVSVPEIVFGQNMTVAFAVQEDLRNPDDVVEADAVPLNLDSDELGGLLDTHYSILGVDGPISVLPGLFYRASYALNTGRTLSLVEDDTAESGGKSYQYQPFLAHLVDGRLQYFFNDGISSVVSAGATFTTGDDDYSGFVEGNTKEAATQFTAVTPGGKGLVFGLQTGNSTTTEVSYSAIPLAGAGASFLSTMQTEVRYYGFFRTIGSGYVSVADVDATDDGAYLGSEVDLIVRMRPFSDLGIGLSGGMFFANNAVMLDDTNSIDWITRLTASLSF